MKSNGMAPNMSEAWDTIVVGAGMGGLTAAAHLVKAGLRVLVLERNPHIGGTAYIYHRNGFPFPMGPLGFSHVGKGLGNGLLSRESTHCDPGRSGVQPFC
jgi:phytoene dehydrogenase-like protein